jgi:hypothetical protein
MQVQFQRVRLQRQFLNFMASLNQAEVTMAEGAGVKRKRPTESKFYTVRIGHRPGIYHTWPECLAQVKGFKGAICKFYKTYFYCNSYS